MRVRVSPPAPDKSRQHHLNSLHTELPALKPPLKWAGGKRWLLPHIAPIWLRNQSRRYVEPFCGGLAVALGLQPARALLNDVNPHLINFYQQVSRGLSLTIKARYDSDLFYQHRDRFNQLVRNGRAGTKEAAQLFYYLNRTGFNGLCRFNLSGEFNVPFGRYKSVNYAAGFASYRALFRRWSFTHHDLEQLPLEQEDFVYADPPYDVEFTSYSAGGFTWEDQKRTAELLAKHRGPVLLSNQATKRIVKLYKQLGFDLQFFQAPRRISSNGNRETAKEVLATKDLK
jgi:DNA adenine methylase